MGLPSGSAAGLSQGVTDRLRMLPSVDELLGRPALIALTHKVGRGIVTLAARKTLAALRAELQMDAASPPGPPGPTAIEMRVTGAVEALLAPSLRRVINATGVILHTNLGTRAALSGHDCGDRRDRDSILESRV